MKHITLHFTFFRSFCFASISISFLSALPLFTYGISPFVYLFWFKMITVVILYYFVKEYKSKEFYFYKNLGISKKALWIFSIVLDMIIYFVIIIVTFYLHGKFT